MKKVKLLKACRLFVNARGRQLANTGKTIARGAVVMRAESKSMIYNHDDKMAIPITLPSGSEYYILEEEMRSISLAN